MAKRQEEIENAYDFQQTVKGIIAVFITILVVAIIVMLFARSLFVSDSASAEVKTGRLTTVEYEYQEPAKGDEVKVTTTKKKSKKKTTTEEEEPDVALPEGLDVSVAGDYTVTNSVYLHPEPNSSSANLLTLPTGAEVKVYGSTNYGWYYLEYDGQFGYAWSQGYLAAK